MVSKGPTTPCRCTATRAAALPAVPSAPWAPAVRSAEPRARLSRWTTGGRSFVPWPSSTGPRSPQPPETGLALPPLPLPKRGGSVGPLSEPPGSRQAAAAQGPPGLPSPRVPPSHLPKATASLRPSSPVVCSSLFRALSVSDTPHQSRGLHVPCHPSSCLFLPSWVLVRPRSVPPSLFILPQIGRAHV